MGHRLEDSTPHSFHGKDEMSVTTLELKVDQKQNQTAQPHMSPNPTIPNPTISDPTSTGVRSPNATSLPPTSWHSSPRHHPSYHQFSQEQRWRKVVRVNIHILFHPQLGPQHSIRDTVGTPGKWREILSQMVSWAGVPPLGGEKYEELAGHESRGPRTRDSGAQQWVVQSCF